MVRPYLEDLEKRIDPAIEEALMHEWIRFLNGESKVDFFCPHRQKSSPPQLPWPIVSINEALADYDRMALHQLSGCSSMLEKNAGTVLNVRTNYGTGILSSVFGAELFIMDEQTNTLPTTRPLAGGVDTIKHLIDKGIPDIHTGFGERCFAMGRRFVELFADYPNVSRYIKIYHPDLQGPMDICELLWGCDLFYALVDSPDLVHSMLDLITDTYIKFMREWEKIVPPYSDYSPHWGLMHKGHIMLRDDSAMNLSPEMFDEFILPYDQKLLNVFGGGAIHFCGRGDHYIDRLYTMTGVYAANMSQPEYNDMECIFQNTVDRGIALIGLERFAAEAAVSSGRNMHGLVHCW